LTAAFIVRNTGHTVVAAEWRDADIVLTGAVAAFGSISTRISRWGTWCAAATLAGESITTGGFVTTAFLGERAYNAQAGRAPPIAALPWKLTWGSKLAAKHAGAVEAIDVAALGVVSTLSAFFPTDAANAVDARGKRRVHDATLCVIGTWAALWLALARAVDAQAKAAAKVISTRVTLGIAGRRQNVFEAGQHQIVAGKSRTAVVRVATHLRIDALAMNRTAAGKRSGQTRNQATAEQPEYVATRGP
jgi:hypothetical protein